MAIKHQGKIHSYNDLSSGMISGMAVYKSTLAVKQQVGVEFIKDWRERKFFMPWNNLRQKVYTLPSVWVINTPYFGKKIIVHPALYDALINGDITHE